MNRSHEIRVASSAPSRGGFLHTSSLNSSFEREDVPQVSSLGRDTLDCVQ